MNLNEEWKKVNTDEFWGEIAPGDHVVHLYENDEVLIETLTGFVGGGINANECVIVMAPQSYLRALDKKLTSMGIFVKSLIAEERYIPLEAEELLSHFEGHHSESRLADMLHKLVIQAQQNNRRVRAFGGMVNMLWDRGLRETTTRLGHLWHKVYETASFCLYCAYPASAFAEEKYPAMAHICSSHSKIIKDTQNPLMHLQYKHTGKSD